jgi:hypothetical protein
MIMLENFPVIISATVTQNQGTASRKLNGFYTEQFYLISQNNEPIT